MDRQQLDRWVPIAYGVLVVICALWIHAALVPVAVVGAILVAVYYSVLRPRNVKREPDSKEP